MQAYRRGLLSFQRSTRVDERWRLKEEILLGEVERDLSAELHRVLHEAESNAAQYVTQEIFDHHYEQANVQYDILKKLLRPYVKQRKRDIGVDAQKVWESMFGALDSPEVQAANAALIAKWKAEGEESRRNAEELHDARTSRDRRAREERAARTIKWS